MKQVLQDVHFSIPLFVVPAGDISPKCLSLMEQLCKEPLDVNCKKKEIFKSQNFLKFNFDSTPHSIRTHPFFCKNFSELIGHINVINEEKYHFYLKSYAVLIFVDYSIPTNNRNFDNIIEIEKMLNENEKLCFPKTNKSYVIFDSPDNLTEQKSIETPICLCNDHFSKLEGYYYILNFISTLMAESALFLLEYGFNVSDIQPKTVREVKARADFSAISNNEAEFVKQIKIGIKDLDSKYSPGFSASFFELIASYEEFHQGIISENKIIPLSLPTKSPYKYTPHSLLPDNINSINNSNSNLYNNNNGNNNNGTNAYIVFYMAAANQYNEAKIYDKCIDVGIKMVISGIKALTNPTVNYITTAKNEKLIVNRCWDILTVIKRTGMNRKAAVIAMNFSKVFTMKEISNLFIIFALNLILMETTSDSLVQIRDLGFPMILDLLENKQNVPKNVFSKFISKILCTIGPNLDFLQQELLVHELKQLGCDEIRLPFEITDVSLKKPEISIIKSDPKGEEKSSVFLYSYLPDKSSGKSNNFLTTSVDSVVTIMYYIHNPLAVSIRLENVCTICEKNENNVTTNDETNNETNNDFYVNVTEETNSKYILPNSSNLVCSYLKMTKSGVYPIKGLEFSFFGSKQALDINKTNVFTDEEKKVCIEVVDKVPSFNLQTDLPISTPLDLYNGEIVDFTLWITNSGSFPITSIEISFTQPELAHLLDAPHEITKKFPLLPNKKAAIHCTFTAQKDEEYISFVVKSIGENDCRYFCTQNIRQYFSTKNSLDIIRIFLLKNNKISKTNYNNNNNYKDDNDNNDNNASITNNFIINDIDDDTIFVGYEVENLTDCTFHYTAEISEQNESGLIGGNGSVLSVAPYKRSELKSDVNDASRNRVITLTKVKEEKIGRSLTQKERIKVAKEVSIMQKLESKWLFKWNISSYRHGVLSSKSVVIDEALFERIESRVIHPKFLWFEKGKEDVSLNEIKKNMIHKVLVDFGDDLATSCTIEILGGNNTKNQVKSGVLWEGYLSKSNKEGISKYDFLLSFSSNDAYKLLVKHILQDGTCGQTKLLVTVV